MNGRMSKRLNERLLVGLSEVWKTYRDFWEYWVQVMKGFECWDELLFYSASGRISMGSICHKA